MQKYKFLNFLIIISFIIVFLSLYSLESKTTNELNIYSGRKLHLIEPLIKEFEEKSGIKINIVTGKSDQFIERIKLEKNNPEVDILLTTDVARLYRAKKNNLFTKIDSRILKKNIPSKFRDKENYWFGLSVRARPIIYSNERVELKELSTYEDLKNKKWKKRVCMRSSNNVYNQSLISSMIINLGRKRTEDWIKGLVNNLSKKPYGGDRDQIRSIAYGECDITIANTYYLANMLNGKNKKDKIAAKKVSIFWPNQKNQGTHVNISGAGIIKGAKNINNAIAFLEFLTTKEAQKIYTEKINEYSIRNDIEISKILINFGKFIADDEIIHLIGENLEKSILIASKNNWR